jgi:hypothetical protein
MEKMSFIRSILLKKLSTVQLRLCKTEHCNRNPGASLRIVIGTTTIRQLLMLADLDVSYCEMLGVPPQSSQRLRYNVEAP